MNKKMFSQKAPAAIGPYSQGIDSSGEIFISGQLPVDAATGKPGGTIQEQTRLCLENIRSVLSSAGLPMEAVAKTTVFLTDLTNFEAMNAVYANFFAEPFPARSTVQVAALPKDAWVEIECIAKRP